jgi:hypothetical protein
VVVLAGLFALVNIIEIVIAAGPALDGAPGVVGALWAVQAAAFGLNLAAIAIALIGLSRLALSARLIPRALAVAAIPGAACLFAGALGTLVLVKGSPLLYVALVGFLVWGVFVVGSSIGLLRGARRLPDRVGA